MAESAHIPRPTEQFRTHVVQFLREQDGGPERQLKERLSRSLRALGVRNAYLALVSYDERKGPQSTVSEAAPPDMSVALCLTLEDEAASRQKIVQSAGADFAALFGTSQRMDIIFLTDQQELALQKVCRPFYLAMDPIA